MQSIGERLEEARKRKGISIREAAESTKIRSDYLHKFESNQYDIRLPEIYVRGFLRSYSNFLKLPADKIIADYNALNHAEAKGNRTVSREVYGRMDISTTKEREAAAASGSTTPPMPADKNAQPAHPTNPNSPRNPATFVPPHSTGSPIDKKLIFKIAIGVAALAVIVFLFVVILSGGSPAKPAETWVRAQANDPLITLATKGVATEVKVSSKAAQPGGPVTVYYQGVIPANESRTLPRRGALRVESTNYTNVQFIIDGKPWDMTAAVVDIRAP